VLFWNRNIGEQVELVLMVVLGLTTETSRVFGGWLKLYKNSLSFNSLLSRGSAHRCTITYQKVYQNIKNMQKQIRTTITDKQGTTSRLSHDY